MNKSQSTPTLLTTLFLALLSLPLSQAHGFNVALTLDGQYDRDLTGASGHMNGSGAIGMFEIQPIDQVSLGIATGLNFYWGVVTPVPIWGSSVDGFIRIMPWGIHENFNSYILLGGGINPLNGSSFLGYGSWAGDYHLMGQVGVRYMFNPHLALDAGVGGDYYSPFNNGMGDLTAHLGMTLFMLPAYKEEPQVGSETPENKPGSLQQLAVREFGDADLYPLIIDANFKDLHKPLVLAPNMKLTIPQNITKEMILKAHQKARQPAYLNAALTFTNPEQVATFKPAETKVKMIDPNSDALWDVAAKEYGDPELYPILVDANKRMLKHAPSHGKLHLAIPHDLSSEEIRLARIKAWAAEYIMFRGRNIDRSEYREWRKDHHSKYGGETNAPDE